MPKLIILVSSSGYDIAILATKRGWPGRSPSYLDCDNGIEFSERPISADRLLCLVKEEECKDSRARLTEAVAGVLDESPTFDCVIGTHTRTNSPDSVLEVEKIKSKRQCQAIQNYGTGAPEYGFVNTWCQELRRDSPNRDTIHKFFDRLHQLLKSNTGPVYKNDELLLRELSGIKHGLVGLLSPRVTDAEAWIEGGYCGEYLLGIQRRSTDVKGRFLRDARGIMYGRVFNLVRVAKAVAARLGEREPGPNHNDSQKILESLTKLQGLLPACDESAASFSEAMTLWTS
jgi:hypothetical protein